ncbi:MAG: DNA primase [Candidatus Omnitrophica bacterium]|nr:DNA primase [Candidatus Omnitrophota bacterium]MCG2706412.1 DNA primase [Candidatus Omnitrophota bacterium]
MAGRIPENILEDILSRVDIVEVISSYIPLKRAGRNFKACCPFHHEKTPSFMVSPDRQIYHCFGCSRGGNAFKFLMEYERMEFLEAVQTLAKKCGVSLPEAQRQDAQTTSLYTQLYKINELAALFYRNTLNSQNGQEAKDYLLKRGVKEESMKLFQLGFAEDKWDALINHLRAKNISLSLLEKAGLILAKEGGGYYDRFRQRIVFAILDMKSRHLGFGARFLSAHPGADNNLAKYINSPETFIYSKGRHLYGLNFAKEAIKEFDYVVIVEGYLDFILPFQEGFKNIVASLGTAFTTEQARLIKRYTHNVVMVYDADKAGELATLRTLDIFIEEGMDVRVVSLPEGFDPDLFVRKQGIEDFKEKIKRGENLFDYKLRILKSRYNPKDIEGKAKISQEILLTINKFKNAVLKSEYIKKLAQDLRLEEDALLQELKKIKEERPYPGLNQAAPKKLNINPAERLLIKLMLEERELIERIRESVEPGDFQDARISRVVAIMFELMEQGKKIEPSILINYFDDEDILQVISESALLPEVSSQDRERIVGDCIQRLKSSRLAFKRQRLQEEIKTAESLGDEQRLDSLKQEFNLLIKMKPKLTE